MLTIIPSWGFGWMQVNDGFSWCFSDNVNMDKQQSIDLKGWFNLLHNEFEYGVRKLYWLPKYIIIIYDLFAWPHEIRVF